MGREDGASFYMVLAHNSGQTNVRHQTFEIAQTEARRLSASNPGVKFYVLQSLGYVRRTEPTEWVEHDQVPF